MNLEQEKNLFKDAMMRRDARKQNVLIATITDSTPHTEYGFVICRLDDGTVINVHAWNNFDLTEGSKLFVIPISLQPWNWYVAIGANLTTDPETIPFLKPGSTSIAGNVPWSQVNTTVTKVNLTSQVTGVLPLDNQTKQISKVSLVINTGALTAGSFGSGSVDGPTLAYVRRVAITGGSLCTLEFDETSGGTVEYLTGSVSTPFNDYGGWVHSDESLTDKVHWKLTNNGATTQSFIITLTMIAWDI